MIMCAQNSRRPCNMNAVTMAITTAHRYAENHLISWFPKLNGCGVFNYRLDRRSGVMNALTARPIQESGPCDCSNSQNLPGFKSMITCSEDWPWLLYH